MEDNQVGNSRGMQSRNGIFFGLVVLVVVGVLLFDHFHQNNPGQSSYQAAVSSFVDAMASGNSAKVDSMESPAFKKVITKGTTAEKNTVGSQGVVVTDNIYFVAKTDGDLSEFNNSFLEGVKIVTKPYKAANGMSGKEESFDTKTNSYSAPSYSPSFTVDVVPSGNKWLIDNVSFFAAAI